MSKMLTSLDYQLIEVNIEIATESYATGYNHKDRSIQIWNFVITKYRLCVAILRLKS